ncbi:MAG: acylphosphatase [Alphaproteobacteria bacterium]|nr:acylphosphatase [Alphaproteobacteria bacterium]
MTPRRVVHVFVAGRVQGVGYRAWTEATARELGLDGWVRNRADGRVEALFAGAPAAIDGMLQACRRGPRLARVDGMSIVDTKDCPRAPGFICLPTL